MPSRCHRSASASPWTDISHDTIIIRITADCGHMSNNIIRMRFTPIRQLRKLKFVTNALYTWPSNVATNIEYMHYRLAVSEANWPR